MRTRRLDVRRLKPTRAPSKDVLENSPDDMPQNFLVTVNVLEGRKLAWAKPQSATSYVILVLDKKKQRTSVRRNMEEPYYKESFVFELYASVRDMQRRSLGLAVMESRCCVPPRLLGEASIDLAAVWMQPQHTVCHKWAQLTLSSDSAGGPVGFLKVDIAIHFKGQIIAPVICSDSIEDNLLLPSGSEQQCASYQIAVYGAYSLPSSTHYHGDKSGKPPSTFVRVSFSGLMGKTGVQYRSYCPVYSEQISIVDMFPNICQMIKLEVCSADGSSNRVLASTDLKLTQISHGVENGFLPTFGPSLLHMYGSWSSGAHAVGEDGPYHRGALLVALKTVVPYYKQKARTVSVEPLAPLRPESQWALEDINVFCPIFEVSMLDTKYYTRCCGVAITMGEIIADDRIDEGQGKLHYTGSMEINKASPGYGYLDFRDEFPVLQFATRLPDFRFRMYRNNMIHEIIAGLENELTDVESHLRGHDCKSLRILMEQLNRSMDDAAAKLLKYLDIVQYSSMSEDMQKCSTKLDLNQMQLQKEEIEKIYERLSRKPKVGLVEKLKGEMLIWQQIPDATIMNLQSGNKSTIKCDGRCKKDVKLLLAEGRTAVQDLKSLIFKTADGWPDVVLWLLTNGSRVAYAKIAAADIVYSVIPEQRGPAYGRIQTVYLKPIKCSTHLNMQSICDCIAARVELLAWLGPHRQRSAFDRCLPTDLKLRTDDFQLSIKGLPLLSLPPGTASLGLATVLPLPVGVNCAHRPLSSWIQLTTLISLRATRPLSTVYGSNQATVVECRVYIYRAKLNFEAGGTGVVRPCVRVHFLNTVKTTQVEPNSPNPVWNEVVKIECNIYSSPERLRNYPPEVLLEILTRDDSDKWEYLGRLRVEPVINNAQDAPPQLQWMDINKGAEQNGRILMSAQLLQKPESLIKTTLYSTLQESYFEGEAKINTPELSPGPEPLPSNLIPLPASYKMDVYWWGLRDISITQKPCIVLEMEEVMIKSGIIKHAKTSCNFTNGRTTQVFEGDLSEASCSPLKVKLYDSSTFGRTLFVGLNVVRNPLKYMVEWTPKKEREAVLTSAGGKTTAFVKVTRTAKKTRYEEIEDSCSTTSSIMKGVKSNNAKVSLWRKIFSGKETCEEEYTLLPMFTKRKPQGAVVKKGPEVEENDWWMRYNASQTENVEQDKENFRLTIYDSELECQPGFSRFKDWCNTLKIYSGKKTGVPEKDDQLRCGYLKVGLALYKWPPPENTVAVSSSGVDLERGYFEDHPNNDTTKYLVRVYVVKAFDLVPKDFTGKSNLYVTVQCGQKKLGDRNNYAHKTVNPVFGKMFELRCSLPEDYLLRVSLLNRDASPPDELIGSTSIDLEDRVYSKHRASVGLAANYYTSGPAKWRDSIKPSAILEELCLKNHLPPPVYPDSSSVRVVGVEYKDCDGGNFMTSAERKESICLRVLQKWHTFPVIGHQLVSEHVETRSLYNTEKPAEVQGKIHLWVDMFPLDSSVLVPAPVNISPRNVEEFELRVVVWDVRGVKLKGENPLDIYVKAWIGPSDEAQDTDIHYRSLNGEGNFNWRMVFHFQYQPTDGKMVVQDKGPFTEVEEYFPPILIVQVQDSQAVSPEEFLGTLMLDLKNMPRGAKLARHCTPDIMGRRKVNFFVVRSTRAWWPLKMLDQNTGNYFPSGMIELELTLLPKEKAILMPVGLGRSSPFPLPKPRYYLSMTSTSSKVDFDYMFVHVLRLLASGAILTNCVGIQTSHGAIKQVV